MDGCEFWTDSHVAPQKYSYIELDSLLIIMYRYIMIKRIYNLQIWLTIKICLPQGECMLDRQAFDVLLSRVSVG